MCRVKWNETFVWLIRTWLVRNKKTNFFSNLHYAEKVNPPLILTELWRHPSSRTGQTRGFHVLIAYATVTQVAETCHLDWEKWLKIKGRWERSKLKSNGISSHITRGKYFTWLNPLSLTHRLKRPLLPAAATTSTSSWFSLFEFRPVKCFLLRAKDDYEYIQMEITLEFGTGACNETLEGGPLFF